MDYQTVANEPLMWVVCSLIVLVVCFQATLFVYRAKQTARHLSITDSQINTAIKTAAISSIGPACGVAIAMLSLIVSLGAPFAWMRLSVIGSVPFELFAATSAAEAAGTEIGSETFSMEAYVNVIWTCTIAALGWLLIVMCFAHRFGDMRTKLVAGREEILPALSVGAMIGAISYFSAPLIDIAGVISYTSALIGDSSSEILSDTKKIKSFSNFFAFISSGITVLLLSWVANRLKQAWMHDWAFGIAIFVGMGIAISVI